MYCENLFVCGLLKLLIFCFFFFCLLMLSRLLIDLVDTIDEIKRWIIRWKLAMPTARAYHNFLISWNGINVCTFILLAHYYYTSICCTLIDTHQPNCWTPMLIPMYWIRKLYRSLPIYITHIFDRYSGGRK